MSQIKIDKLTFAYDGASENIFENVSIILDSNWKIGLIGRNGRGKTTLLKLLLGQLEFHGKITSNVCFKYFPYEINDKDKTGIEIITDNFPEYEIWEVLKNFKQLELEEDCLYQRFTTLSSGQQTKFLLAVLFSEQNNFLLIDEPTNHLDVNARQCVSQFLNRQKGFILVSHDREFVNNCVNHILSINKNNIELQSGNFSSWLQNKQNQDEFEIQQNEKLQKEISRLRSSALRTQNWSDKVEKTKNGTRIAGLRPDKGAIGHKATKMAKRAKVIELRQNRAIEEKSKLLKNIDKEDELFIFSKLNNRNHLLEIQNLSIFYGTKKVVENVNLSVANGDKVAILGNNGSGKTSLLKLILGENIDHTGTIFKNKNLKLSYISQTFPTFERTLTDFAKAYDIDLVNFFTMLKKLGFERTLFDKPIQSFSAGQKKKVLIAKSLCEEANLYIWDEPLNYIDVISRIQIEKLLKETDLTIIFVEHDASFTNAVATKNLIL